MRSAALTAVLSAGWLGACETRSGGANREDTPAPGFRAETVAARDTGGSQVVPATRDTARLEGALRAATYDVDQWPPGDPAACGLSEPPPAPGSVVIYFGCRGRNGAALSAVPARRVRVPSGADPKETALQRLLDGPTAEEARSGYVSTFGPSAAHVAFTLRVTSGLATVDFDPAIRNVKFIFVSQMEVAQIVATLAQFPDVQRVAILIGGQAWCRVLQAGC